MASSGRLDFGTTRAIRTRDWRFRGRASPIRPCLRQLAQYTNVDALNSRPSANAFAFCPLALHSRTRSDHFVSFSVMRAECRSLRRPGRTGLVQGVRHVRTDGVSQSNINATKLAAMPIPLPSLTEQDEVIRRGTKLLALADAIERRVQAASARADRLPQAILSKAFSGELVPTEADLARAEGRAYETAEELLARVGREVENGAGNATGSHRPTREVGQKHGRRAAR
jgi:hypothetical protein